MKQNTLLKDQRGVVLVVALVMLLVLTLIGISGLATTSSENNISGNQRLYNQAFYAADAGIEAFRADAPTNFAFLSNPATSGNYFGGPVTVGGNTYDVTWTSLGLVQYGGTAYMTYQVTSVGTAPNFLSPGRVTVEAIVDIGSDTPGYD